MFSKALHLHYLIRDTLLIGGAQGFRVRFFDTKARGAYENYRKQDDAGDDTGKITRYTNNGCGGIPPHACAIIGT